MYGKTAAFSAIFAFYKIQQHIPSQEFHPLHPLLHIYIIFFFLILFCLKHFNLALHGILILTKNYILSHMHQVVPPYETYLSTPLAIKKVFSIYRIRKNIGEELNLAIWRTKTKLPIFHLANIFCTRLIQNLAHDLSVALWQWFKSSNH